MSAGPYRSRRPGPGASSSGDSVECPGCSRRVEDSVRACPGCGTPVATLRCASCYQMNPPDRALCGGCGRELGLEPIGEPDVHVCPDCRVPFQQFRGGAGTLRDCGRCGGQFVEHPLLRELLEQREAYGRAAPRPPPRHNPLSDPVRYVPCPLCSAVMLRKNFGRSSGVIVDVCTRHGVWFDRGELPRVLAFVEAGGLALARRRERDAQREEELRERLRQYEESLGRARSHRGDFDGFYRDASLLSATVDLADFVAGLLGD